MKKQYCPYWPGIAGTIKWTEYRDVIHVESFELSPRNEYVIKTVGRLQRQFSGPTIALSSTTFDEPGFRDTVAPTLAKMSRQPVAGTKNKV